MTDKIIESAIMWGPGMVLSLIILIGIYKFINTVGTQIVKSSREGAEAVIGLTKTLDNFITRDNSEHREIIILMKVMMEKIQRMEEAAWTQEKKDTNE